MSDVTAVPIAPVKRSWLVWLVGAVAIAAFAGIAMAWAGTARTIAIAGNNDQFLSWHKSQPGIVTTASGLQYQVIKPAKKGELATPTDTDVALINYKGELRSGKVFDKAQGQPLQVARVVPGFSEALKLMSRGSTYRIWIPSELGYGAQAQGEAIPANSVLIFDIDMIDFKNEAELQAQMQAMQAQGRMPGVGTPTPR